MISLLNYLDVCTFPAIVNMEWCCGRSKTEKESLKELILTLTLTLTLTLNLTLNLSPNLTLTLSPQTNNFGSDSQKSNHFDIIYR